MNHGGTEDREEHRDVLRVSLCSLCLRGSKGSIELQDVEECDATGDAKSTTAKYQTKKSRHAADFLRSYKSKRD
jgi:hypothetical protein